MASSQFPGAPRLAKAASASRLAVALLLLLSLVAAACNSTSTSVGASGETADSGSAAPVVVDDDAVESDKDAASVETGEVAPEKVGPVEVPAIVPGEARTFAPAPDYPDGPLSDEAVAGIEAIFDGGTFDDLVAVGEAGDARAAWVLADLLRFVRGPSEGQQIVISAFEELTGAELDPFDAWGESTDLLIAWDTPAPPDYVRFKRLIFERVEQGWGPFFDDAEADIDWRHVSWGGVLIDDRSLETTDLPCPEGCIPAINDPATTDAAGGDWYPDDAVVFGIEINGEARAYPKNVMEVHEMTNDTLGGRRIGVPYCTLCGAVQAYFTDDVSGATDAGLTIANDEYELRTSGLLIRSNKVMYEFHTKSVFDTFTGEAVTGPLREAGVSLEPVTVVTTTWADWKATHPDTTILAANRPWGGSYPEDPLRGRDDNGPIFPIGDNDARLPVQEPVLGVIAADGTPVAFPVEAGRALLINQETVESNGISVRLDGRGLKAELDDGTPVASHQAFWFAWSQFHPGTVLWLPPGS